MVDYFEAEESRLFIFDKPLICHFCSHDVFIPYETYQDVEKPGIQVIFVHYMAIYQQCGFVVEFGDASRFDAERNVYRWALNQKLIHERPVAEGSLPMLTEEDKQAQKKCIYAALQLLVYHKKVSENLLTMFQAGQLLDIAKVFDASYEWHYSHMATQECLVKLLVEIRNSNFVHKDQFD